MKKNIFLLVSIFILSLASASFASMGFDLKGGIVGNGGYGIGGSVFFPVLAKNLNLDLGVQYQGLKSYTGTFYPIFVSLRYDTSFFDYPVYFGGGVNYLLGSAKQNNLDVQGGIGFQGFVGTKYRINDLFDLIGEGGLDLMSAKVTGGSSNYSTLAYLFVGLRFNMGEKQNAAQGSSEEELVSSGSNNPRTPAPGRRSFEPSDLFKTSYSYKSYTNPKALKAGQPIKIIIISKGAKIKKCSATFENKKTIPLIKKTQKNVTAWKNQFVVPKTFKKGNHKIIVLIMFMDNKMAKQILNFKVK